MNTSECRNYHKCCVSCYGMFYSSCDCNCVDVGLRKHDVAFLLTIRPSRPIGTRYDPNLPFIPQVGLTYVRGCEIEGMLDENGRVIEEGNIVFLS